MCLVVLRIACVFRVCLRFVSLFGWLCVCVVGWLPISLSRCLLVCLFVCWLLVLLMVCELVRSLVRLGLCLCAFNCLSVCTFACLFVWSYVCSCSCVLLCLLVCWLCVFMPLVLHCLYSFLRSACLFGVWLLACSFVLSSCVLFIGGAIAFSFGCWFVRLFACYWLASL